MKYFKKLVGDRIYLSPVNTEDVESYAKWLNDFDVTDYIGRSASILTIESERNFLNSKTDEISFFAIVTINEDKLIGNISLNNIDQVNRSATLGIFIGDKNYLNQGYGTESIKLILDYGFNYLNLNSINLNVMEFNPRAIRCYEKCGFKEYGRKRKCKYINGKYYDSIGMDILKEEFNESFIRNKNI